LVASSPTSSRSSALLDDPDRLPSLPVAPRARDHPEGPSVAADEHGQQNVLHSAIAACHLTANPGEASDTGSVTGTVVFDDDDLRVTLTRCRCGLNYLRAWRRLRGSYRAYLIPATDEEVELLSVRTTAAETYTTRWSTAEGMLSELAQHRPYIELEDPDRPGWVPRWAPPSIPWAFTWSPF
jgi:hypothetical protein